jgi:hypothetical protein
MSLYVTASLSWLLVHNVSQTMENSDFGEIVLVLYFLIELVAISWALL